MSTPRRLLCAAADLTLVLPPLAQAQTTSRQHGAKALPGVREQMEAGDASIPTAYVTKTATVIERYANALDADADLLTTPAPRAELKRMGRDGSLAAL